jgi:GT2 family glycosyltransferase
VSSSPKVSVVVPTLNGRARLPVLLERLRSQTLNDDFFEIIIVDDGSADGTIQWAEAQPDVSVIRPTANVGQGAASNLGARAARSPLLAMTDDDTEPADDWLEQGLRQFDDPAVCFFGGQINLILGAEPSVTGMLDYGTDYLNQEFYVSTGFAATANFWARRDPFLALGGFKETFVSQCHDVEFGARLQAANYELLFAPKVVVHHPPRATVRAFARKQFRVGFTASELRREGVGAFVEGPPLWARMHYYRPWLSIWGLQRVRALGYQPRWHELIRMWCIQYFGLQLPLALGNARGAWRTSRR